MVDAAFDEKGKASSCCVIRDEKGVILGVWTEKELIVDSFCAVVAAAVFAMQIGEDWDTQNLIIEGEALLVVQALKGEVREIIWKN